MKVIFYYVRHGQTLFNLKHRIQGSCDSPLTSTGRQEAHQAEKALEHVHFDKAFTSSSERASDTADIILAPHGIQAVRMKGLKEFDFGEIDGEKVDKYLDEINRRKANGDDFTDIGGDSFNTISERIQNTFQKILSMCSDGDRVLIVSHGAYCGHLIRTLLGIDPNTLRAQIGRKDGLLIPNAGIMKFEYADGRWSLLSLPCEPQDFHE